MCFATRLGLVVALVAATGPAAAAQSVAARTPNLDGGWLAESGTIQLNFVHRFSISSAPVRKITNTPTFHVGTGVGSRLMVGVTYGSASTLVPAYPNEWEPFVRVRVLEQADGVPLDVVVQGGWNAASESFDGQLALARSFGRLRLLAEGRAFSAAFDAEEARFAVAGGATLRLTRSISVGGDYGVLLERDDAERVAWGAGLQLGVPRTPHSFSIQASNVGTGSLEGASRGTRTRWGFEYTVPIELSRFLPRGGRGGEDS